MSGGRAALGAFAGLAAALVFCAGARADGAPAGTVAIDPQDAQAYQAAPHFKALAASLAIGAAPLIRYSFNYDTPGDALRAALAYCEAARAETGDAARRASCVPVMAGPYAAEGLDDAALARVLARYLDESIVVLRQRLELTGDRAVRTSLETMLHKSGRYAESEALLTDLAAAGEALARNALAYHWAERDINLDQALAYADSAVAAAPETASFRDTRALVLFRLGKLDEARLEAERAVALDPHPIILDHAGDILWAAGRCPEAGRAWRRAIAASHDILFRRRVAPKLTAGPSGPPVFD